jgi:single-stranded-DNA-specific exonuclease
MRSTLNAAAVIDARPLPAGRGARKRWRLRAPPHRGRLAHSGLPALVAQVLENRGVASNSEAQAFLGGREAKQSDPFRLPGFEAAVSRLRRALHDGELVGVFGDFDVDGVTSTTILTETLRDLGGAAEPYIPHREREGYGLNRGAIESLADRGVRVLVTCDCGTSNIGEVAHARSMGVDVVVVDHHLPPQALPDATALLNPKLLRDGSAFIEFSTGGIAHRLAEALYAAERRPFPAERYLPLAALSTVADMVPLLGENRTLIQQGLDALAKTERPGLRALMEVANVKPKEVSSETIAFALAPRLNAAGRLAHARLALDLLLTDDEATALALATEIDVLNRERQRLTLEAQTMAGELVEGSDVPLLLVGHEAFHQGIIGLVASRLVESFGRPAVVYQKGDAESRGSCRSILPYDITGGLRACGDLFERYGGHHQAGGFTIRNANLEALEERLVAHAAGALDGFDLSPTVDIDAEWPLGALRSQEIRWLGKLQPHGVGNPEATLLSRNVSVLEARAVGEEGRHLRLKLKDGASIWPAIAFGWEGETPAEGSRLDVVYSLSADRYGPSEGGGALQLALVDCAPSAVSG